MTWLRIQLWCLVLALCAFGLVMVASTTAGRGGGDGVNLRFVTMQAVAMGAGLAGAAALSLLGLTLLTAPMAFYLAVFKESYRWERITAFVDPFSASGPAGYHLVQSYVTIAHGGVWGVGLGEGTARLVPLPENHTDFIYAMICGELGMVGGLAVAAAFLLLVATGLLIALRAQDLHARLLAIGVTVALGTQAFWNMLVATGAVPTKGLTLPFISYGGSSAAMCLCLIGVLDAVARAQAAQPAPERPLTRVGATIRTTATRVRLRPVTEVGHA
jgi:cell division protein FtsW